MMTAIWVYLFIVALVAAVLWRMRKGVILEKGC